VGSNTAKEHHDADQGMLGTIKLNRIHLVCKRCYADWNVHYLESLEYKQAFVECNIPQHFSRNTQLGQWIRIQQKKHQDADQRRNTGVHN
jgi:hypothetical protein